MLAFLIAILHGFSIIDQSETEKLNDLDQMEPMHNMFCWWGLMPNWLPTAKSIFSWWCRRLPSFLFCVILSWRDFDFHGLFFHRKVRFLGPPTDGRGRPVGFPFYSPFSVQKTHAGNGNGMQRATIVIREKIKKSQKNWFSHPPKNQEDSSMWWRDKVSLFNLLLRCCVSSVKKYFWWSLGPWPLIQNFKAQTLSM